ncbi:MAG: Ppx/GppA family phosphatase [Deltaproteobacteria bacterium]|nr:MAG: Ppx/GppA family phosphatase [Deltaproteobacteria bacterium]
MQRFASIDVGSNTLRLLIAENAASGPPRPIQIERRITRLGEHFLPTRTLQPRPIARSIAAMKEFSQFMAQQGVSWYRAGATAVVREAINGPQFLRMVEAQAGLQVRLLSSSEEAHLSFLGVTSVLANAEALTTVFDIGGGSTELVWQVVGRSDTAESCSLPLGVVHLTEAFLQEDPPGVPACGRLRRHVEIVLEKLNLAERLLGANWVGTAGSVTTLASMHLGLEAYDPDRINGVVLRKDWLADLCNSLAHKSLAMRSKIPGLEPGREDIILAGALITLQLMDSFGVSQFAVSDAGLLEGLFLDLCQSL